MEELAGSTQLADQLSQSYPGAGSTTSISTTSSAHLVEQAGRCSTLAELERELREQGVFERAPDGSLRLSPKAMRRLGESALRDVVDKIGVPARRAGHPAVRRGRRADRREPALGVR